VDPPREKKFGAPKQDLLEHSHIGESKIAVVPRTKQEKLGEDAAEEGSEREGH
jgi:hypothetical protein